jgi:hypothetical protein
MASSIASGSSGGGNANGGISGACDNRSLTSTLTMNGKLIPFINTDYSKKKNLLLQNFPARVSTPSKTTLQLLESNPPNYRESFTDFTLQIRSNLYSRHLAQTDFKDQGMLNINATQVVPPNQKTPQNASISTNKDENPIQTQAH